MEDQRPRSSPHGKTLLAWEVDEYPKYQRSIFWFAGATIVVVALLWYALATVNFLFALIIIIFAIVAVLSSSRSPSRMRVTLTEDGLELGTRFHSWRDFERFWIVYNPPLVKSLYFDFRGILVPSFGVPLEDIDPNAVRNALLANVREDLEKDDEPFTDSLARLLKI